jgi:ppGpp synthetase/RelA/SpoT-type nucleotidyltranferase
MANVDVVAQFVASYAQHLERYEAAARFVRQELRVLLRGEGLRAIVTSRAKGADRLEQKLRRRHAERPYETLEEVRDDVHDLVGARVALYYPGTQARVNRLIAERFESLEAPRAFPASSARNGPHKTHDGRTFERRFSGYAATHHRVHVRLEPGHVAHETERDEARSPAPETFAVEIQVASVLMHAWAEVEHDLVYKPLSGELSLDEYSVLDELNGLVLAGELALERLERAESTRLFALARPFDDAYELAGFLGSRMRADGDEPSEGLGRTDVLFALLRRFEAHTPSALLDLLTLARSRPFDGDVRIAERLAQAFVSGDEAREAVLRDVSRGGSYGERVGADEARELGTFLERYRVIDRCLGAWLGAIGEWGRRLIVSARGPELLVERGLLRPEQARALGSLRLVRDRVLRQDADLDADAVRAATASIEALLDELSASEVPVVAETARFELAELRKSASFA